MSSQVTGSLADAAADKRSVWLLAAALIGAVVAALGWVFRADIASAVEVWYVYPSYSHCFLILPISLWLVWERRAEILAETPAPEILALPLSLLPALLWLVGFYSTTNEIRQIAVVSFFEIALFGILGRQIYWRILFPALFLYFLVPTGEYLIPPLQRITADFTDWGLTQFGVVHFREGTVFELANGRYSVAEACAGLRFLTATFTLGTLFCYFSYRRWWKSAAFLIACIVVPIAANGVRVLATIMVANFTNNRVAAGVDHIVYGWGFAVAIMLVLLFLGSRFRDPETDAEPRLALANGSSVRSSVSVAIGAALVLAIALGPAIASHSSAPRRPPELATLPDLLQSQGWTVVPLAGSWRPTLAKPSAEFAGTLEKPGEESVDVVVDDYANAARDGSLIAMKNRFWDTEVWSQTASGQAKANLGSTPTMFAEAVIASPLEKRLVWSCYWIDGRTTTSPLKVKFLQLLAALSSHDEAAVIVFSTPLDSTPDEARARLKAALAQSGNSIRERLATH